MRPTMIQNLIREIVSPLPKKTFFILLAVWFLAAILNFISIKIGYYTGCDWVFPFSVIHLPYIGWEKFIFALLYAGTAAFAYKYIEKLHLYQIFLLSLALIVTGNLLQGTFDIAFLRPFYYQGRQYYHDALAVQDGLQWLQNFNADQGSFQLHTNTHPPFAVLLHHVLLQWGAGSVGFLAVCFVAVTMLYLPFLYLILKEFSSISALQRKWLILLSAAIPAVNIYSAVSLDGPILAFSTMFLWAVVRICSTGRLELMPVLAGLFGLLATNMLSYSGLFLFAFGGLVALYYFLKRQYAMTVFLVLSVVVYLLLFYFIYVNFNYDHLAAFRHASKSENRYGFMLTAIPYVYFWTRFQDVAEILLYLSLGCTTVIFAHFRSILASLPMSVEVLVASGFGALGLMLLSGAYGTGETARACLYIYPFFILLLSHFSRERLRFFVLFALVQTFFMQFFINHFW